MPPFNLTPLNDATGGNREKPAPLGRKTVRPWETKWRRRKRATKRPCFEIEYVPLKKREESGMSIKVMDWVWEHSRHKGSDLLLLLAIADHAHDDGDGAYPSIETLARKIRMSERHTSRMIQELVQSGELAVKYKDGPKGANLYRVTMCDGGAILSPDNLSPDILSSDNLSSRHPGTGVVTKNEGGSDIPAMEGSDIAVSPEPSLTVREPGEEPEDKSPSLTLPLKISNGATGQEVWPDWYATLYAIPGFKTSLAHAKEWLDKQGAPRDLAETKAYALKGWWNPKKHQGRDAWATFQAWIREGLKPAGTRNARAIGNPDPYLDQAKHAENGRRAQGHQRLLAK